MRSRFFDAYVPAGNLIRFPRSREFFIIENGGNRFDHNTYRVTDGVRLQFIWGHALLDFAGFRGNGQERNGTVVTLAKSRE
jgi:hypothetical protein